MAGLTRIWERVEQHMRQQSISQQEFDAAVDEATAVVGNAQVICTRDTDFNDPSVHAYCLQHGIRVLSDPDLLRLLTTPPSTPL